MRPEMAGPAVNIRRIDGRKKPWRAQWRLDGRSFSKFFSTEEEAKHFALAKATESIDDQVYPISVIERAQFHRLREACKAADISTAKAIDDMIAQIKPRRSRRWLPDENPNLRDACDLYLRDCKRLRPDTADDYRQTIELFIRNREKMPLRELTAETVVSWLAARYSNPNSLKSRRATLRAWLNWCADPARQWITSDVPADIILAKGKKGRGKVPFLRYEEAAALLAALPSRLRAPVALCLFAGVRPQGELFRLSWEAINWRTRTIDIAPEESKTEQFRRLHDLPDNLWAWLETVPRSKRSGPIVAGLKYNRFRQLLREHSPVPLPQDVLRHSFGTHAFHRVREQRGLEWAIDTMGHVSGFDVYTRHYKGSVPEEDAVRYFSIYGPASLISKPLPEASGPEPRTGGQ